MSQDRTDKLDGCLIQHGTNSQRVYVMKWSKEADRDTVLKLDALARQNGYTKIFAKVPLLAQNFFQGQGYVQEGLIPGYFSESNACVFLSKFIDPDRAVLKNGAELQKALLLAKGKDEVASNGEGKDNVPAVKAKPEDAEGLAEIYRAVFATYPFPVHDPAYIRETMKTHIDYYIIPNSDRIMAAASSEKDLDSRAVEMTDFATLPEYRRKGAATVLLGLMEKDMRLQGVRTCYTIARAVSIGMNVVFAKRGYEYGGTLINNTNISGEIESMNIWYKSL